jgi:hypothetical protein
LQSSGDRRSFARILLPVDSVSASMALRDRASNPPYLIQKVDGLMHARDLITA